MFFNTLKYVLYSVENNTRRENKRDNNNNNIKSNFVIKSPNHVFNCTATYSKNPYYINYIKANRYSKFTLLKLVYTLKARKLTWLLTLFSVFPKMYFTNCTMTAEQEHTMRAHH